MNILIKIDNSNPEHPTVSGRELYKALGVKTAYEDWFKLMCEYGFTEDVDFRSKINISADGSPVTDHMFTISTAKEICILQRTEIGKKFRRYFLSIEEARNSPDMVIQRALAIANTRVQEFQSSVSQLTTELANRNCLTFSDVAKELGMKRKDFIQLLLEEDYIYKDEKENIRICADKNDNLFEFKEGYNSKPNRSGSQILVTLKGREEFRNLLIQKSKQKQHWQSILSLRHDKFV